MRKQRSSATRLVPDDNETLRHLRVREAITRAIREGTFAPGSRLPGERELAQQCAVSYATVRRAVAEMVEADLLERRPSKGTYVRIPGSRRLDTVTVNLIYPLQSASFGELFVQSALAGIARRGWHHHLVHLQTGRERAAVRALQSGEPAILLSPGRNLDPQLYEALSQTRGRAVLLGARMVGDEVPSVMADDAQVVRLMMGHLQEAGHRAIGFISKHPTHPIDRLRITTWKECSARDATPEELEQRLIVVDLAHAGPTQSDMHLTFAAVRAYLESPHCDVTALLCGGDTTAMGTLAACRAVGRPVPEKMSLVSAGDTPMMEFHNPPVTCVDVHLDRHVEVALQLIEAALNGETTTQMRHLIAPTLIVRETVASPFHCPQLSGAADF